MAEPASASALPDGITDPNYRPLPGRLGNLTVPQQHALETLKKELTSEGHFVEERMDDSTLLRFLRARKFDVPKAKAMLVDAEKWRKDFGVDEIMKNFVFKEKAAVQQYYPQYYHNMDKDGRPIYIESLSFLNFEELDKLTNSTRQLQHLVYEYEKFISERLPACSKAVGHPVETSCTILDVGGVSVTDFYNVQKYLKDAASIGQNMYPECMGKFYIINASWAFQALWRLIKPLLDEVTVAKIDILGDKSKYMNKLLEQIPPENLPSTLGGLCDCEGGCSMSDVGPWNPRGNEKRDVVSDAPVA